MIFNHQLELQRIQKAEVLKKQGINPYPHNITKNTTTKEFLELYKNIQEKQENSIHKIAGRIRFLRHMGKAAFAKIDDEESTLQIYFSNNSLGDAWFENVKKNIEVGDIIVVSGFPFVTKTGELSLHANELTLASKAIIPLPEKFHGLQDNELRYRQRYLDMIMNSEVKKNFSLRSKILKEIRNYFEERGFLEVETPMMHPIAGGANARPFITHHNALGVNRFLRIAPELYLKRLVVGGMHAIYEINRNFRNEGMDHTHNPEFTMLEFYWAYHNYHDSMDFTEKLFEVLLEKLNLPKILTFNNMQINFSKPFKRIAYLDAIVEIGKVDKNILNDKNKIIDLLASKGVEANSKMSLGYLYAELFDLFVESKLIDPTFIIDFPIDISPLSRRSDTDPNIAERFEFFIAGSEIANGYNELNDPIDQYNRFKSQIDAKNAGDDEAHEMDEDFVRALGYAMPPTVGQGIGIDRLVMLLTNQASIRDVILFPSMKPLKKIEDQK